ncbi:MAG: fibronectin type III domain-containing protein [Bacteroidales bacterium]|nr:fibronectin type III domain-containing protein [Bacteroidales bacterium]
MKLFVLSGIFLMLVSLNGKSQNLINSIIINPQAEGGFSLGNNFELNGWNVSNGTQVNQWVVGTSPNGPSGNCAYISNNGGINWNYDISSASVVHFYRDVTFPTGETEIYLSFLIKGMGEGVTTTYDHLKIFLVDVSTTPTAGTKLTSGQIGTAFNLLSDWIRVTLRIPSTNAGTTKRLVFSWENDNSVGTNPPIAIDNILLYSFSTIPNVSGNFTIDNSQPTGVNNFNSFGEAVAFINGSSLTGPVNFIVTSGQVFKEIIPPLTIEGKVNTPISFKKSDIQNAKILRDGLSPSDDAVVTIQGGDYITFEGIDVGLMDPSNTRVEYGYYITNVSATNGANNNTIKNCNIILNRSNTSSRGIFQNVAIAPSSNLGTNSNNTYQNLFISNVYHGISINSNSTYPDDNITIAYNIIGSNSPDDIGNGSSAVRGISLTNTSNAKVYNNIVRNLTITSGVNLFGIYLENCRNSNNEVYNNKIFNLKSTSPSTSAVLNGIRLDIVTGGEATAYNNVIYGFTHNITTPSSTMVARAFGISGAGTVNLYYNSVHLNMNAAATNACVWINSGTINMNNNIFANTSATGNTSKRYCIYRSAGTINNSNYNDLYIPSGTNNFIGYYGSDLQTLFNWQTATNKDWNSINVDPSFTGNPDLKPSATEVNNKGTPLAITKDITGADRDPFTPDMGAYEFTPPSCPIPTNLTISSITGISAHLSWNHISAFTFELEYGIHPLTQGNGTFVTVTGNSYTLTNLNPNTNYDVYIRAICGSNDYSEWIFSNFTTLYVASVPYFEGFNTTVTPQGYNTANWTIGTISAVPGNPPNNIYKNLYSSLPTATFTTCFIGPIQTGMKLSFDYKFANYSSPWGPPSAGAGNFKVEISNNWGQSYSFLDQIISDGITTAYSTKVYDLNNYAGQYISIKFTANWVSGDWYIAFDNIKIKSCLEPTNVFVNQITNNSATINFSYFGNPQEFEIEYGPQPLIQGNGQLIITSTVPYQLSGLTGNTTYDFYVRAKCNETEYSAWVGPFSFKTACDPFTSFPLIEGFEGVAFPPECWQNIKHAGTGTPGTWNSTNSGTNPTCLPRSGNKMIRFNSYTYPSGTIGLLISPYLTFQSNYYQVKFWMYRDNGYPNISDRVEVYFSPDLNMNNAILIGTVNRSISLPPIVPNTNWYEYTFNLPTGIANTSGYVIFAGVSNYGNNIYVDDITIKSYCPTPSNITISNVTYNSATINWTHTSNNFLIEYGVSPYIQGTNNPINITQTSYTLTGLSPETQYDVYIKALCEDNEESEWVGPFTFETLPFMPPTINPTTANYDLYTPSNINTLITWNNATSIISITDNNNYTLVENIDFTLNGNTLTILQTYLAANLFNEGDQIILNIIFDAGSAQFIITAVNTAPELPSINPTEVYFDLNHPTNVYTIITWNDATYITQIKDQYDYFLIEGIDYHLNGDILYINKDYILTYIGDVGNQLILTITFDVGTVQFIINAIENPLIPANINPTEALFNLNNPQDVSTTVTWNDAAYIEVITDNNNNTLLDGIDYYMIGNVLYISSSYLSTVLQQANDQVVLTIIFNVGSAQFTITAINTYEPVGATINPNNATYDIANPSPVSTTITWNDASSITSIVDNNNYTLISGTDYSLTGNTLTILQNYLAANLLNENDQVILNITFDVGSAVFTITAINTYQPVGATINPTNATYDIANPSNISTTITWNDASTILSIQDNHNYILSQGTDYTLNGNILTILQPYLAANLLHQNDQLTLNISFDVGSAVFTITAINSSIGNATINPTFATYDLTSPSDVHTNIIWNGATQILMIIDSYSNVLSEGEDYQITNTQLTIKASYLQTVLHNVGDSVILTIQFDQGTAIFIIKAIQTGFIELTQKDVKVYPNPAIDVINIIFIPNTLISIYDMNNKLVHETKSSTSHTVINISSLASGQYTIKITDRNKTVRSLKLVKQ